MSGPPSAAGTRGTVAVKNVPTSPTIRIAILIARFMGSSPAAQSLGKTALHADRHYRSVVKDLVRTICTCRTSHGHSVNTPYRGSM